MINIIIVIYERTVNNTQDGSELAQNVRSENGVLYIDVARLENQGVYVCQTTSEQAASVPILVTVVPLSTPAPAKPPRSPSASTVLKYQQEAAGQSIHNNNFGPGTSQRGNTLIISNAQDEDGGYYMCTGSVDGTVVANTYVMVEIETRIPPKVEIWPQGELAVTLGGQFEFHCRVLAGVPPPEILWSRSRERSLSRSTHLQPQAVLKFERIEVNDEGEYICTATNVAGQASANATLKVRSVPEITLTPGSFIEANPGEPVEVHCRANGYPEPMVSIKLRSDDRELVPPSPGIASLRVGAANERDDGDYVCTAVSAAGTVAEQFTIRVERGDIGFGPNGEGSGETDFDPYGNPDQDQNPEQDPNYYPDQQRPTPLLAIEGQDSTLGCDSSNGLYTVQWVE
ncbi:peroxidasin homolog [Choristoneura fumiferana]|uniref:peroxidasin homolog n=1 Tax=Choristoneura fumiferana TaxID=7141 RepID=UPI003D154A69